MDADKRRPLCIMLENLISSYPIDGNSACAAPRLSAWICGFLALPVDCQEKIDLRRLSAELPEHRRDLSTVIRLVVDQVPDRLP